MAFCSKCGTQAFDNAAFCAACGTNVTEPKQTIHQHATQNPIASQQSIANVEIPENWKIKFDLIEKAGGVKLPKARDLTSSERSKIIFNWLAFLFGPIYYLVKGMWKKAITLFVIAIPVVMIVELIFNAFGAPTFVAGFASGAIFSTRANIDYYKKIVLKTDEWI